MKIKNKNHTQFFFLKKPPIIIMFALSTARVASSRTLSTLAVRSLSTSTVAAQQKATASTQNLDPVQKIYIEKLRKYQQQKDAQRNSDVPMNEEAKRKVSNL